MQHQINQHCTSGKVGPQSICLVRNDTSHEERLAAYLGVPVVGTPEEGGIPVHRPGLFLRPPRDQEVAHLQTMMRSWSGDGI
jgi:hypothetical protein